MPKKGLNTQKVDENSTFEDVLQSLIDGLQPAIEFTLEVNGKSHELKLVIPTSRELNKHKEFVREVVEDELAMEKAHYEGKQIDSNKWNARKAMFILQMLRESEEFTGDPDKLTQKQLLAHEKELSKENKLLLKMNKPADKWEQVLTAAIWRRKTSLVLPQYLYDAKTGERFLKTPGELRNFSELAEKDSKIYIQLDKHYNIGLGLMAKAEEELKKDSSPMESSESSDS